MAPSSSRPADPCDWFGRLQRSYLAVPEETLLEELADIGRLMAVTGVAVESVLDVHAAVLAEELARDDGRERERLVRDAAVCLSELLVAWRIAAEGLGVLDASASGNGLMEPVFLWFDRGGGLVPASDPPTADSPPADIPLLAEALRADSLERLVIILASAGSMAEVAAGIGQRRIVSFEARRPEAASPSLRVVVCPFHDGGGIVGIRDITARRAAAEAEFQRRKLESLGQLAGGIAHEINNLLQPILTCAQFLVEDHGEDAELAADAGIILDSARAAAEVVRDVLAFARRPSPHLTPLSLVGAVAHALDVLRKGLPPGVRLTADLAAGMPPEGGWAAVNSGELTQVLRNLVGNAVEAVGGAGHIAVRLERAELGPAEAVRRLLPAGAYLRLSVADDGRGVDPETARRLFDPFFTTKPIGQGTGLGLSIVRSIVQSWGGEIGLDETVRVGARFDLLLPEAPPPLPEPAAEPAAPPSRKGWIAVVEDDAKVRAGLVRILQRAGHQVRPFARPAEALAALAAAPAELLVTDLVMPEMDGLSLIKALRRREAKLPVLLLTGGGGGGPGGRDLQAELDAAGGGLLLFKPVSGPALETAVGNCLRDPSAGGREASSEEKQAPSPGPGEIRDEGF